MIQNCTNCKKDFSCSANGSSPCWCNKYPPVLDTIAGENCMCKKCLHEAVKVKVENVADNFSANDALNNNWVKDLPKSKAVLEGIDYYEENKLYVFTKWHHLKRGYCCKNNCRHCGYK